MDKKHEYTDTIKQAAGLETEECGESRAESVERKKDDEIAFEAMAINASMGMLGMEETTANLLQLELAQEILFERQNEFDNDNEYKPFD